MRNPNRINPIIEQLRALWLANPDLRFGQLVSLVETKVNASGQDFFNAEDDKTKEVLENLLTNQF